MNYLSKLNKIPLEYYIVFFLFLTIIFMSVFADKSYASFSQPTKLNMYDYEGFQNNSNVILPSHFTKTENKTRLGLFELAGLKAAPVEGTSISDPVSVLKGSPACIGSSGGYSNDSGGLCLTDAVRTQLMTRGGNQSKTPSQIG